MANQPAFLLEIFSFRADFHALEVAVTSTLRTLDFVVRYARLRAVLGGIITTFRTGEPRYREENSCAKPPDWG
jgi:hypothetical protein